MPPGVGYTITAMSGGATNPTLTTLLSNLGVQLFDYIDCPYTDTASLNALQAFLSDASGRWSAEQGLFGHVFSAYRGTFSARTTFGTDAQRSALLDPRLLRQPDAGVAGGLRLVRGACDPPAGQSGAGRCDAAAEHAAAADRVAGHAGRAEHAAVRRAFDVHGHARRSVSDRPLDHDLSAKRERASPTTRI